MAFEVSPFRSLTILKVNILFVFYFNCLVYKCVCFSLIFVNSSISLFVHSRFSPFIYLSIQIDSVPLTQVSGLVRIQQQLEKITAQHCLKSLRVSLSYPVTKLLVVRNYLLTLLKKEDRYDLLTDNITLSISSFSLLLSWSFLAGCRDTAFH